MDVDSIPSLASLPIDQDVPVAITFVETPTTFWCQLLTPDNYKFHQSTEAFNKYVLETFLFFLNLYICLNIWKPFNCGKFIVVIHAIFMLTFFKAALLYIGRVKYYPCYNYDFKAGNYQRNIIL